LGFLMAARSAAPVFDLANIVFENFEHWHENVQITAENFMQFWRIHPGWSYRPVCSAYYDIIAKCRTVDEAGGTCANKGPSDGIVHNQAVARMVFEHFGGGKHTAFKMSPRRVELRKNPRVVTTIRPNVILLTGIPDRGPVIQVPVPRKGFSTSTRGWSIINWFHNRAFMIGDEAGLPVMFFDMSAGLDGVRKPKIIWDSGISSLSDSEASDFVKLLLTGYDRAIEQMPKDIKPRRIPAGEDLPLFPGT
jgi:hypothetical protein